MKKVSMYTFPPARGAGRPRSSSPSTTSRSTTDYDLADVATQDEIMRELEAEGVTGFPVRPDWRSGH